MLVSIIRFQMGVLLVVTLLLTPFGVAPADEGCEPAGDYQFVCGMQNAEDIVQISGSKWLVASSLAPNSALYLINSQEKSWSMMYDPAEPRVQQDMETYVDCPGAPGPDPFVTHGLNIRTKTDSRSTLYVVGHGGREAIEVFEIDSSGAQPILTWVGCVMTPDGMAANSVTSLEDGSLLVTIPLHAGIPIGAALAGEDTGAVYAWSPGDSGFTIVEGTLMPYPNGIEVSADGEEFYIASSGRQTVEAYSNTDPAEQLRVSSELEFVPDNIHMTNGGRLLTAGLHLDDPVCGKVLLSHDFSLEEFAACPRAFTVLSFDPGSLQSEAIASGPANKSFSNITMAVPAGDELWIGTFSGDRVAYRKLDP